MNFRDGSDGCSGLLYCAEDQTWWAGGSLGLIYSLEAKQNLRTNSDEFSSREVYSQSISSLAYDAASSTMILGCEDSVIARQYPEIDDMAHHKLITRRSLAITHLQFTSNGQHL